MTVGIDQQVFRGHVFSLPSDGLRFSN
jgi:hypothetical protein